MARRIVALIALAASLVGTACTRARSDETTLRFWGLGREGEVVRDLLPEFEREHPGIRVEVQQIPWTAAHEKLLTAYVGRSLPDVGQVGNSWIPEFHMLQALAPLRARFQASVLEEKDYFPGIWAANVDEGDVWGIPWYVDTRVMFYRRDLLRQVGFDHAPRTWEEWLRAARAIKRAGHAYAQLFPTDEWAQPVILGMQAGSPLLVENGTRGAFSGPEFTRAFEFYTTFFREDLAPKAINAQLGNIYQQFAEGWYAMYLTGPWNLGEFRRRLPGLQERWDAAPLPHPSDPTVPGTSLAGGSSLVIFSRSRHQDAAWALIEYLSRPEVQVRFYGITGDLPAHRAAWSAPSLAGDPQAQAFYVQLGHVQPYPKVAEWEQIVQQVAETGEYAVRGRTPVPNALRRIDAEVDRILEKRRWVLARQAER